MISVKSYNWEFFERWQLRFVIFAGIFGGLVILSIIYWNYVWAVVLILFLGWYLFASAITTEPIDITITPQTLNIWEKNYNWNLVQWFYFEVKTLKSWQEIKNIIFVINNKNYIHTFKDDISKIRDFVAELNEYTQLLNGVKFTTTENISRSLKL